MADIHLARRERQRYHCLNGFIDQNACMLSPSDPAETVTDPVPIPEEDDLTLIRRIAAKDREAFKTLYYRYVPRLGGYLSRLLKSRELVEEVINDVMLVVWQNAARFDPTGRLSTWLFGIAHHKALKALARSSRHSPGPLSVPLEAIEAEDSMDLPAADDPEQTLMRQDLSRLLAQALEILSPEHRAVVELTFYEDFSYQEIAAIMGCPVNTVKTRMFYARRRLAEVLARLGLGGPSAEKEETQ